METSFCDLRKKLVINMIDGSCMGHIIDIVFDTCSGRVCGIILPERRNFWACLFAGRRDIYIPSNHIVRIGCDVILVKTCIEDCIAPKKGPR